MAAFTVCLSILIARLLFSNTSGPTPLARARLLIAGNGSRAVAGFYWLTPTRALAIQNRAGIGYTASWFDPASGVETPAAPSFVNNLLPNGWYPIVDISPDSRWILCTWFTSKPSNKIVAGIMAADGAAPPVRLPKAYHGRWLPDGSGWLEEREGKGIWRVPLRSNGTVGTAEKVSGPLPGLLIQVMRDERLFVRGTAVNANHVVTEPSLEFISPLKRDFGNTESISMPDGRMLTDPIVSPDEKRILWQTFRKDDDWRRRLPAWAGRLAGYRGERTRFEVWTSDLKGASKRLMSSIVTPPDDFIHTLAWSPDSKWISFKRNNDLWIMPSE